MGIPQTSYNVNPARGVPGMISRSGAKVVQARVANGAVRAGQYVVLSGDDCAHPSAKPGPSTRGGVVVRRAYGQNDGNYADNQIVDILTEGFILIDPENAVAVDGEAFVRNAVATTEELGAFRSDAHTTGLLFTVDTAENSSDYSIEIDGIKWVETADGDATVAEVATGLKNAIDGHADYVATNPNADEILVVRAVTSTLHMELGALDSRISVVDGARAFKLPGGYYRNAGSALVELELRAF